MSFLITGATGFIGKHVVSEALKSGHKVEVVTRSISKAQELFGSKVTRHDYNDFLSGDIKVKADKAIHLAWADVSNYMDEGNLEENLNIQRQFVDRIISCGIKDITIAGTCLEYGMKEGACVEDMEIPLELPTSYAKLKTTLYSELAQKSNINLKWLRFFYVYGVGSRPNSLLSQLLKAIEEGEEEFNTSPADQKRDFIHIDTLAHNVVAVANQTDVTGIINIGNGWDKTVEEFIETIMELKGHKMKLNKGHYPYASYEPHEFWADINKLKSVKAVKFDDSIFI